jgi:phosphate transport system permease protein
MSTDPTTRTSAQQDAVDRERPVDTSTLTPEGFGTPDPVASAPREQSRAGLTQRTILPRWAEPGLLALSALVVTGLLTASGAFSWTLTAALTALVYVVGIVTLGMVVEGPRRGRDRLATALVTLAFLLAMVPLVSLIVTTIREGFARLDVAFFTTDMTGVLGEGGGAGHAIVGTLMVTGLAAVISIPVGVMAAIYLVEYGEGTLKRVITFLVDVMTGIPSIVAGLFAFALFSTILGDPGHRSGIAGAIALAVLMTPVVIRSCEEMLKLVPDELREASYALGVPRWRTITKVVLPTAVGGIVAGVTIAIARVIGETAPLLITMGFTVGFNFSLTEGRIMTLPVFAYYSITQPGVPPEFAIERGWAAALTLVIIVMLLNAVGRLIAKYFAPSTNR